MSGPALSCMSGSIFYYDAMSTFAEIEAAVEALPRPQQEKLMALLAERIGRRLETPIPSDDPFEDVIGAFAGPRDATGRKAEEILYGTGS